MKKEVFLGFGIAVICVFLYSQISQAEGVSPNTSSLSSNWPQWRGPLGSGVAPQGNPPTEWSESKNIRWKISIEGKGHSSPIVWNKQVFITSAIASGNVSQAPAYIRLGDHNNFKKVKKQQFVAIAIDRSDGSVMWQKTVFEGLPHEGGHDTGSYASASPITDGRLVFVFFGSKGLAALDLNGKIKWTKLFGEMNSKHGHGEGTSPALLGDVLVLNWDHEGQSFIVALNKNSGEEIWKKNREEVTSWATPFALNYDGVPQVIVCGSRRIRSYDLKDGRVIWECGGLSANIVASPIVSGDMVYAGSSYVKRALLGIDIKNATGDLTNSKRVLWKRTRGAPYIPSLLLYEEALYCIAHYQNVFTRLDAKTGANNPGTLRLQSLGNIYASPVASAGRIFITGLNGTTMVLSSSKDPQVLAVNPLDDSFSASAAISGDEIFLRGKKYLYCIGSSESTHF